MNKRFEPRDQQPTVKLNLQVEPGMVVDRFELDRFLGNGGMGEVWLAIDPQRRDDRRAGHVVLKFLRQDIRLCAQAVNDFQTAYRRVQDLIHENICALLELGNDANLGTFQVMHYVSGSALDQIISERRKSGNGRFSLKEVIDYLSPVARALDYAHEHEIIHRDIKPGNIMVDGETGRVRVVDFGLAAEVRTSMSQHSQAKSAISGTESYMAPEQWMGRSQDGRSDQYSLGVVVWEMLTGGLPFVGSGMQLAFAVTNAELPSLPDDLQLFQEVLGTALAKNPADRFATCQELIANLWEARNRESAPRQGAESRSAGSPSESTSNPTQATSPASSSASSSDATRSRIPVVGTTGRGSKIISELPAQWVSSATGMKLKRLEAGRFQMGSDDSDPDARDNEKPAHQVTLTKPFYMGIYPVTQGEWISVMGTEPWKGEPYVKTGIDYPATYVSFDDAQEFLSRLNKLEEDTGLFRGGWRYVLPTEAQWEYAARAGTGTRYSFGDDTSKLFDYGWFDENTWDVGEKYAHRVGQKLANRWGLYDMHGNVWEWCSDWYAADYYSKSDSTDPTGPTSGSGGTGRVLRGGGFLSSSSDCRSAYRYGSSPGRRYDGLGFRLAFVQPSGKI